MKERMPLSCEMQLVQYNAPLVIVAISNRGKRKLRRTVRFLVISLIILLICVSIYHGYYYYGGLSSETLDRLPVWRKFRLDNFYKKHYKCSANDTFKFGKRISGEDLEKKLFETGPRAKCGCNGDKLRFEAMSGTNDFLESHCGAEATRGGGSQKVVSFCLFGKKETMAGEGGAYFHTRYFKGILKNLEAIKIHYPGWVTRIYTNLTFQGEMCDLVCADSSIYFCDVNRIEGVTEMHPMTWRFLPLGDPTVTKFVSRDLDSVVTARERSAVTEWESSGFPFHGMRDNPWHVTAILGGMWGADNTKLCYQNAVANLKEIMKIPWNFDYATLHDQHILSVIIYRQHNSNILVHDSYLCNFFEDSIPFPTQRPNVYDFVGRLVTMDEMNNSSPIPLLKECPRECRPQNGLDWEYC